MLRSLLTAGVLAAVNLTVLEAHADTLGNALPKLELQPVTALYPPTYSQQSDLNAGGLRPPPSVQSDPFAPPSGETAADLERSDEEDSGRGLQFLWLNGEVGLQHLGLQTFSSKNLLDTKVVKTTQTGLVYGGGAGIRLLFLTLGARFRLGNFDEYQVWTLNAEGGIRIPLGAVEPYFTFGGGYASLGAFDSKNVGSGLNSAGVDVTGYNVRGGGGLDIYLGNVVSIGASVTGDVLFLSRPGVDPQKLAATANGTTPGQMGTPAQGQALASDVYAADGSSIGGSATFTAVLGLHF
ncbi:MAG: hypothetical protein SFV15_04675 [Polyangiaceae bacterium]|nr:hypothetical protein [Polyangiaceae bacterium]